MSKQNKSRDNDNGKDVIKHSGAVHMSGEISLLERKMWNVLLANAFNILKKQEVYEIKLRDLAHFLSYNSNDHEFLKSALKTLNQTQVEWNILEKDKQVWAATTLLAGVEIINGICRYGYSFVLREKLSDPAMYARLNLYQQTFFKSKYAHIFWELFKDYFIESKGQGETPWITVGRLRKLLGLHEGEYSQFKELNKLVIKKGITEINNISDLYVDLNSGIKKRREGRKVGALKFIIKRNPDTEIELNVLDDFGIEGQKKLPVQEFEIENQKLFETLTVEFGISNGKAIEILKTKDEFYLEEVLESVRKHIDTGKIENIPAFTVTAIEQDYRQKKSKAEKEAGRKREQKKNIEEERRIIAQLKEEFHEHYETKVDEVLFSFTKAEKMAFIEQFEIDVIQPGNKYLKKSYHQNGLEGAHPKSAFRGYVADKHLSPEDSDFIAFARKRGYDLKEVDRDQYRFVSEKM